jgi:GDP-L-fucose synthase
MKIILSGSNGFLGKNIVPLLEQNHEVIKFRSSTYDLRFQSDCFNLLQEYDPDVVIHAAGTVGGIGANKENPGKFMYENLIMGTNIIHQSMVHKVSKFILLGTVCSYPKHTPVPFKEEELWNGYPEETNAPYGIAKKTLMRLVEAYNEQYGFNGVNLVPVNMYGPHDHFNLTSSHVIPALILKFYNAMKEGDSSVTLWGTGQVSREFLYAPDCAEAIQLAIKKDVSPEPINIGTGQEIKICDLAQEIAQQMGYEGEIIYDNSKPDGQPRRCLDTTRAKKRLSFEAKTGFKQGLKNTIEWFLGEQQ